MNLSAFFFAFIVLVYLSAQPVMAQTVTPTDTITPTAVLTPTPTINIFDNSYLTITPTPVYVDIASSSALAYGGFSQSFTLWQGINAVCFGIGTLIGVLLLRNS